MLTTSPRDNATLLGRPYQVCLLVIAVLTLYYPTMFAEVSVLDDREAISGMLNTDTFDLKSILFPRSMDGGYYRPLIGISYAIDRFWWFLDSKIMHFENILMHLINTLLVFWLGSRLCRQQQSEKMMLPFWGALLFALHPINAESVNWISGRTDPLACMFVLAAMLLVLRYKEQKKMLLLLLAGILALLGALAKETALGFFPASIFILMVGSQLDNCPEYPVDRMHKSLPVFLGYTAVAFLAALLFVNYYLVILTGVVYWLHCLFAVNRGQLLATAVARVRSALFFVAAIIFFGLIFYGLRKLAFTSDISKISTTLRLMIADFNYTIQIFMGAAGFYVKKFFIPAPLNIAIREIDPLYELFGVVCFMGCVYLITLRRVAAALVLAGFFMLAPAFPFAFGTIAWTAFAERYDYIPSAFWILGSICFVQSLPAEPVYRNRKFILGGAVVLVALFAGLTFERNLLWQTNIGIFKDAVEKSPTFKNVRGIYITALVGDRQYEEAERQYFIAKKLHSITYDERYDLLYASLLMNKEKHGEVERVFAEIESKTNKKSEALYEGMVAYYDTRLFNEKDVAVLDEIRAKKIYAIERLYELNKSPHTAYKLGQAYMAVGDYKKAYENIKIAAELYGTKNPMKRNSEVLLKTIERKIKP